MKTTKQTHGGQANGKVNTRPRRNVHCTSKVTNIMTETRRKL